MKFLKVILLTTVVVLSNILTATVSASIPDNHCFDHDPENSFCYKTQKQCEMEQKNDRMAEGKCYKALD